MEGQIFEKPKNQKTKKTKKTKKTDQKKSFPGCVYFGLGFAGILGWSVRFVCFISQLIAQKKEGKIKKNQKTLKDKKNPYSWVYRFLNVYTYGMEFGFVALGSFANYLGHG